jgi:predicted MPP superfamily phosphohydrolase
MAVTLFGAEVVTGFGLLVRRRAPTLRGLALLVGLVLAGVALVQGMRPPVVRRHEVHLAGLPARLDGTVIVAVSDLHLGNLLDASWLAARVDQILEQRPDLVLFLGDIFEGHGPVDIDLLAQLRRLTAPLGLFAVTGNHEHYGRRRGGPGLEATGLRVLRDRRVQVSPGLILAGVDDLTRRRRSGKPTGPLVADVLRGAPPGGLVFLSHAPLHAEQAATLGADLMLSGHTHGGQLWPLGYLVRLAYPFLGGRYEVKGMPLIVCRGTGTWGPRMRLWHPGEILRITLRARN